MLELPADLIERLSDPSFLDSLSDPELQDLAVRLGWQADQPSASLSERDRDRLRKLESRRQERDILVPPCANWHRREDLEQDTLAWLAWYFPHVFWHEFTDVGREMITAIENAARFGTDQSIAGPRGEGKSNITERVLIKCAGTAVLTMMLLFAANGKKAAERLDNIRKAYERNDRLAADYPEYCTPILALEGINTRARAQTITGTTRDGQHYSQFHTYIKWDGDTLFLPRVPFSPTPQPIIACYSLEAEVRGVNIEGRRPEVAIIDDADTEETTYNEEQAGKLERKIDRGIAGLAGQGHTIARVMLATIPSRKSVAFKFTDPAQKPSWMGKRFRLLVKKPEREDLWAEYMSLRSISLQARDANNLPTDPFARRAHRFYLDHRAEMDAVAVVSNPYRHKTDRLPDGTQVQESTLQFCYDLICDIGEESFNTEYQNDPPEEAVVSKSNLTPTRIQKRVCGIPQRVVPRGATWVTQGIDVKKTRLHWVVRAWRPEGDGVYTGFTIDYGTTELHGILPGSDEGVDEAIRKGLHERRDEILAYPYADEDGRQLEVSCTLIDSRWKKDAVFRFCEEAGIGWLPGIGYGRSSGCAGPNFSEPVKSSPDKVILWRCYLAPRPGLLGWQAIIDVDHYKAWEHARLSMDVDIPGTWRPGSLVLFGDPSPDASMMSRDERGHSQYARHICAEEEVEEYVKNVLKRYWKVRSRTGHWLDASVRATVAAVVCQVRLLGMPAPIPEQTQEEPQPRFETPDGRPFLVTER